MIDRGKVIQVGARRLAAALVLTATACRSGFQPVPLPLGVQPLETAAKHQVLYATDRALLAERRIGARAEEQNPDPYGPGRSRTTSYGVGHVVLQPEQQSGSLQPVLARLDRWSGGARTFFEQLSRRASGRDVVVFVHGFNNSLREATFRAALLAQFLGTRYVPVVYSWPAKQGAGFSFFKDVLGYLADRDAADWTVRHCRAFLLRLARAEGIRSFHLVAHSTGAAVLTRALREIQIRKEDFGGKLGRLVLAAPDVDLDVFFDRFVGELAHLLASKVTVLLSREDPALNVATRIRASYPRLGNAPLASLREPPSARVQKFMEAIELIDVTAIGKEGETHAYFVDSPLVSSQLIRLFHGHSLDGETRSASGLTWLELRPVDPPPRRSSERGRAEPRYPSR